MIQIYKANSELGFALFHLETNKFMYGESCDKERLVTFINSFPEHEITIFIEREWQDELQDLFFLLPHLEHLAKIKVVNKVSVKQLLAKSAKEKKKRKFGLLYIFSGIILGSLLLLPTSYEYKNSVIVKAEVVKGFTSDFVDNQPNEQSREELYSSIANLYQQVRVEAVTYSTGNFKIVFSTTEPDLKITDFKGFETAVLKKASSLGNEQGVDVHIYELEGSI